MNMPLFVASSPTLVGGAKSLQILFSRGLVSVTGEAFSGSETAEQLAIGARTLRVNWPAGTQTSLS
jgi:hypothetical protein